MYKAVCTDQMLETIISQGWPHGLKQGAKHLGHSTTLQVRMRYPLNVYTRQNPRRHVVFIEIQPNAYNNYLSQTSEVILTFAGVIISVYLEFINIE